MGLNNPKSSTMTLICIRRLKALYMTAGLKPFAWHAVSSLCRSEK